MMAEALDDGEFWLPPKFLSDEDILMEFSQINKNRVNNGGGLKGFGDNNGGFDFSSGFRLYRPNSDLSSPGESVVGSTETESDEDDFLYGLSRKLANSTLSDELWKMDSQKRSCSLATSPQSILCNVLGSSGCGCKHGSSRGSPNCHSPPPSALASKNEEAWDLLYAAAGEVAKMRKMEETVATGHHPNRTHQAHHGPPRKLSPIFVTNNQNIGFHSNQSVSYQQLQANQFQQLKQQQLLKQQLHQQGRLVWGQHEIIHQNRARNGSNGRSVGLSPSAWPTLQQSYQPQPPVQQPAGSGMRAIFLGDPGAKRECSGTGVFLPRRVGTPTETLKKPGCSTVLLPDRVVQALNLNLEVMDTPPHLKDRSNSNNAGFSSDYDAALRYRNNVLMAQAQQRRNVAARPQQPVANNELRLPQEWTY